MSNIRKKIFIGLRNLLASEYFEVTTTSVDGDKSAMDSYVRNPIADPVNSYTTNEFRLEIAKGNVEGHSSVAKFGENPDIDTASGFEHIWDAGGAYVPPTTARIHDIASDSAADAGTLVSSGTATGGSTTTLVDSTGTFVTDGVAIGDAVLNDTQMEIGFVSTVTSETELVIIAAMRIPTGGKTGSGNSNGDAYRIARDASTGAAIIHLQGNDAYRLPVDEFVILNGVSDVATVISYTRQSRARIFTTGNTEAVGTITSTAQIDGTVTCQIINGNNQTLMAVYTVPFGRTGYLLGYWASLSKKANATVTTNLRAGILDGVGYILQTRSLSSDGTSSIHYKYEVPAVIPGGADLWLEASTDTNNTGVSGGFDLILVED